MTDQIIGWLLLKDIPTVQAGTISSSMQDCGAYWGADMYWDAETLKTCTDFFLPVYKGEEVCPECKGGKIKAFVPSKTMLITCPTCHGQRKITKQPEKPKCTMCGGHGIVGECPSCSGTGIQEWEWPPTGRDVWVLDRWGVAYKETCYIFSDGYIWVEAGIRALSRNICFPTRALAEEYAQWRKDRGIWG